MRSTVIQVSCSRCSRVETITPPPPSLPIVAAPLSIQVSQTPSAPPKAFFAALQPVNPGDGITLVEFPDLCTPCMRAVSALLAQAGRKIDGLSPDCAPRAKKDK